jgi:hypothetical protein
MMHKDKLWTSMTMERGKELLMVSFSTRPGQNSACIYSRLQG